MKSLVLTTLCAWTPDYKIRTQNLIHIIYPPSSYMYTTHHWLMFELLGNSPIESKLKAEIITLQPIGAAIFKCLEARGLLVFNFQILPSSRWRQKYLGNKLNVYIRGTYLKEIWRYKISSLSKVWCTFEMRSPKDWWL